VAVKRKRHYHKPKRCTQDLEADSFKKRPCGPVLKDSHPNPPAPGAPRGWGTANLVPAAACHFAQTQKERKTIYPFLAPYFLPRPIWKVAASCRSISPAAAVDQALSALDPDRTVSGDRKATRYWALGFGHGAALAETSPAPVRQRPGNRFDLYSSELQAPTTPFAHR